VLATSRTVLHVSGEREFPLGPLDEDAAVVLFCERAKAVGREVRPDDVVARICRRLDSLPLAIELAASRTRLLDPAALLQRLDHSLAVLTGGPGDAPQRQRTLRATIEWSHDLLDDDARDLFARLAVFAGGATLRSAEEICAADLDTLAALVDSSLVKVVDAAGTSRLLMLETIREYAAERLAADPELTEQMARRHAEHYAAMAQRLWDQRRRAASAAAAVAELEAEAANSRSAEEWSREHGEVALQLRLLTGADTVFLRGPQSVFRKRVEAALQSDDIDDRLRGRAHAALSFVSYRLGDAEESDAAARRALELGQRSGDVQAVAMAHNYLANRHNAEGRAQQARELIEHSLALWQEIGDDRGELVCRVNLSDVSLTAGAYEAALSEAAAALAIARRFGDPGITAVAAVNAALASLHLDRLDESAAYNAEGLDLALADGDEASVVCCLRVAAALAIRAGDLATAARLVGRCERMRAEIDLTLEPAEKALHEQVLRDLTVLGDDRLRAELAAGAAMSLDEALAGSPRPAGSGAPAD
jgi:tetratricopeptide (TPR) repeat protein